MVRLEVLKLDKRIGMRPVGSKFQATERDAKIWAKKKLVKNLDR